MRKDKRAFTLVELIVVIAVIGILSAVLIPTFSGATQSANKAAVQATADAYRKAYLALSSTMGTKYEEKLQKFPFKAEDVIKFAESSKEGDLYLLYQTIYGEFLGDPYGYETTDELVGFIYLDGSRGYYSWFDAKSNRSETAKILFRTDDNNTSYSSDVYNLVLQLFNERYSYTR